MLNSQLYNLKFKKSNILFLGIFLCLLVFNIQIALLFLLTWICLFPILKKDFDIFRPINYFSCWYYYYYGLGFLCYQVRCYLGISQEFDKQIMIEAQILSILVILILKLLIFCFPLKKGLQITNQDSFFIKKNIPLLLLLTIINFGISLLFWKALGGIPLFIKGYHDSGKATLGQGLGYFEYLQGWCSSLLVFVLISTFYKKQDRKFSFLIVLFNFCVIPLLSDTRGGLVSNLIAFFILYSWNRKRIKVLVLFFAGLCIMLLAGIWGVFRGGNLTSAEIIILLELGVEFDNYVDVIKMFPKEFDFTLGSTYIPCFTLLFPRFIMPNKNDFMTGGEYFKYIKHHDYIRVGERFTMGGELFMNFGLLGCLVLTPLVFFLILRISDGLYNFYIRDSNYKMNFKLEMIVYLLLSFACSLLAGDTATAFSGNFYGFMFIIMFFFIMSSRMNNKGVARNLCKSQ